MSKAPKYYKGQSPGFVLDYRHAGENMAESEGFGCSGGFDTEMTLSEDSCAPKRKCISLIRDGYNSCGIPKEVLSLSKIPRFERENLIRRLKMDLKRVQDLRKKLESIHSVIVLSPHSDIHSCSDGPKRLPPESFGRSASLQGKKQAPLRNNISRSKKGSSVRSASAIVDAPTSHSNAMVMKQCETLLNRLMSHQYGWPFLSPVDPVKLNIPDYFNIIKHPMDLGTIKSRLCKGEYFSPLDFAADVRLTFSNSMVYNPPGNEYHFMAQALGKYFETRWRSIEKKIIVVEPSITPLSGNAYLKSEISAELSVSKRKAAAVNRSKLRVEPAKLVMTDDDKKKLRRQLEALEEEIPGNIVDFLKEHTTGDSQSGEEEIEIDIDALSDEILFKLRNLLDDYIREKKKYQERNEPCEMEIVHDLGLSNSPAQPNEGDGLIDEDVDIVGGNDPPVSSYPPLKMEKDATCRNNECTTSSSSPSESGSSSSDSGPSSPSGSEPDTVKASYPTGAKDKEESGVAVNREDNSGNDEEIVNNPLNELSQVKQNLDDKPSAIDADGQRDEETAPSDRQISPEKLYRAALLKNRFADTILKAREKALDKDEKGDPEKLRIEREELERRLREEKARLQAEAKAAEEAKRKAEAEAAAKARRKREQEREAARLALQKMEKTVDINENSQFLDDLEMLRAVAEGDQLPSFMEETSSEYLENMLGSFKMEGNSNPLAQLGLYMKMDEEEDEEEDAQPPVQAGEQAVKQNLEKDDHSLSWNEEGQQLHLHKAEEMPVEQNEGETQSLVLNREVKDDQNKADEMLVAPIEGETQPLVFNREEDDHPLVGNEESQPLNPKTADEMPVEQNERETQSLVLNREEEEDHCLSGSEEGQLLEQNKADEQSVEQNGEETKSVILNREEEDNPFLSGSQEHQPLNQNKAEEHLIKQDKGKTQSHILTREEEDDRSHSGNKEGQPLNLKEQDEQPHNGSLGGEQVHGWNEGDEKPESAIPEQENDGVDSVEQENDGVDSVEQENDTVD